MFPKEANTPVPVNKVIKATLVFETVVPPKPIIEEQAPSEPLTEDTQPIPVVDEIEEPQTPPPEVKSDKQPETVETEPVEVEEPAATQPLKREETKQPTPPNQKPAPASLQSPITSMAKRHLNGFQQQQQNRVAQQAARNYQQLKNSPIIDDEIKDRFLTEDEKLVKKNQVRIDCSSTTNQVALGLASLMGGNKLKCSKGPPIDGFIKSRLNREPLLLNQYKDNEKKSQQPQSVVIKELP
jgi:hypothetical protein